MGAYLPTSSPPCRDANPFAFPIAVVVAVIYQPDVLDRVAKPDFMVGFRRGAGRGDAGGVSLTCSWVHPTAW